jgi:hypothetical protein
MDGGRRIAKGDTIFVFASENQRRQSPTASGGVTSAKAAAKKTFLEPRRHSVSSPGATTITFLSSNRPSIQRTSSRSLRTLLPV